MKILYENEDEVRELDRIIEVGLLNMKKDDILRLNHIVKNGKISITCVKEEKQE